MVIQQSTADTDCHILFSSYSFAVLLSTGQFCAAWKFDKKIKLQSALVNWLSASSSVFQFSPLPLLKRKMALLSWMLLMQDWKVRHKEVLVPSCKACRELCLHSIQSLRSELA